jgi:hypothetical protein
VPLRGLATDASAERAASPLKSSPTAVVHARDDEVALCADDEP